MTDPAASTEARNGAPGDGAGVDDKAAGPPPQPAEAIGGPAKKKARIAPLPSAPTIPAGSSLQTSAPPAAFGAPMAGCRRMLVDLSASNQLNYKKLCKRNLVETTLPKGANPQLEARLGGGPVLEPDPQQGAKQEGSLLENIGSRNQNRSESVLGNVIKRLEMLHQAAPGMDSDDELDEDGDGGDDIGAPTNGQPGAATPGSAPRGQQRPAAAKRAPRMGPPVTGDDNYDFEDPFIDDGEMVEMFEADRTKPKHSGFFINKGSIEKQAVSASRDSPMPSLRVTPLSAKKQRSVLSPSQAKGVRTPKSAQKRKAPGAAAAKRATKAAKPAAVKKAAAAAATAAEPGGESSDFQAPKAAPAKPRKPRAPKVPKDKPAAAIKPAATPPTGSAQGGASAALAAIAAAGAAASGGAGPSAAAPAAAASPAAAKPKKPRAPKVPKDKPAAASAAGGGSQGPDGAPGASPGAAAAPKPRKPRAPKVPKDKPAATAAEGAPGASPAAAAAPKPKKPRAPKVPKDKPAEDSAAQALPGSTSSAGAAAALAAALQAAAPGASPAAVVPKSPAKPKTPKAKNASAGAGAGAGAPKPAANGAEGAAGSGGSQGPPPAGTVVPPKAVRKPRKPAEPKKDAATAKRPTPKAGQQVAAKKAKEGAQAPAAPGQEPKPAAPKVKIIRKVKPKPEGTQAAAVAGAPTTEMNSTNSTAAASSKDVQAPLALTSGTPAYHVPEGTPVHEQVALKEALQALAASNANNPPQN